MAKQSNGFLGGFSGRLGTAVGYSWRGKWCLRSLPSAVRNPRTEAQQQHRSLFKQEVQLAGRMNQVLRRTLNEASLDEGMTPCNLFVKRNQRAFSLVDGRLEVDWEGLTLSSGPVAPVAFGVPELSPEGILSVGFEKNPLHVRADQYDRVMLYVYCPEVGVGFLTAPVYRRDQRLSSVLPDIMYGHELLVWGMVQDEHGRWSETIYVGVRRSEVGVRSLEVGGRSSEFGVRSWESEESEEGRVRSEELGGRSEEGESVRRFVGDTRRLE